MTKKKMEKKFCVYILASGSRGTLYTGISSDLPQRMWKHKTEFFEGFTKKYGVKMLVYYEMFDDAESAIRREKRIKKYKREWKINLIEHENPYWDDLYEAISK